MKTRKAIGVGIALLGAFIATTVDGSIVLTAVAIAMFVGGGLLANIFDFQKGCSDEKAQD